MFLNTIGKHQQVHKNTSEYDLRLDFRLWCNVSKLNLNCPYSTLNLMLKVHNTRAEMTLAAIRNLTTLISK